MNDWKDEMIPLETTFDSRFAVGRGDVQGIYTPRDRKAEFIVMEDGACYARLKTSFSAPVLYPFPAVDFRPKAKAVLMDLDGTSVISEEFWIWMIELTMQGLLKDERFSLEEGDIPYVSGFSVTEHLQYCIDKYRPGADISEARRIYQSITGREMKKIMEGGGRADAFRVRPQLKEFLLALKDNGIKIGLVTSGLYEKAMPEIVSAFRQMQLGEPLRFYDAVVTAGTAYGDGKSGTLGEYSAKPHPWLYSEIAGVGLGLGKEDACHVVVLEDSSAGVLAGRLAGYPVIGMEGGNIRQAGLDCLTAKQADTLSEVLDYLLGK